MIRNTNKIIIISDNTGNLYFYNVDDCHKAICKEVNIMYIRKSQLNEKMILTRHELQPGCIRYIGN